MDGWTGQEMNAQKEKQTDTLTNSLTEKQQMDQKTAREKQGWLFPDRGDGRTDRQTYR